MSWSVMCCCAGTRVRWTHVRLAGAVGGLPVGGCCQPFKTSSVRRLGPDQSHFFRQLAPCALGCLGCRVHCLAPWRVWVIRERGACCMMLRVSSAVLLVATIRASRSTASSPLGASSIPHRSIGGDGFGREFPNSSTYICRIFCIHVPVVGLYPLWGCARLSSSFKR